MNIELSKKQLRRLLDMVYIGNWVLNSTRGEDRIKDYDEVESLLFAKAREEGMSILAEDYLGEVMVGSWEYEDYAKNFDGGLGWVSAGLGEVIPSRAFAEGGIHEAIMDYENNVFFEILAEDLARRDMDDVPIDESNYDELTRRIDAYIDEFERNGTDNIVVESEP